jgi:ParB family chromosome partitioning protein
MIKEIPLDSIKHSPFSSRLSYSPTSIDEMANSMAVNGQLVTVKVRPINELRKGEGKDSEYELIFGYRRFLAAKKLGWKTIRAEIVHADDEETLRQSLVENFEREELSDYEKACIFETLNTRYNKTYDDIGRIVGISKQQVSSYIGMLRLFDASDLASDSELRNGMLQITEHHARILSRVGDKRTRADLVRMIIKDKLSVRDLTHVVSRLRSWFSSDDYQSSERRAEAISNFALSMNSHVSDNDQEAIIDVVFKKFQLAEKGDFESFKNLYLVGSGFTLFPSYPPFDRFEDELALLRERCSVARI